MSPFLSFLLPVVFMNIKFELYLWKEYIQLRIREFIDRFKKIIKDKKKIPLKSKEDGKEILR